VPWRTSSAFPTATTQIIFATRDSAAKKTYFSLEATCVCHARRPRRLIHRRHHRHRTRRHHRHRTRRHHRHRFQARHQRYTWRVVCPTGMRLRLSAVLISPPRMTTSRLTFLLTLTQTSCRKLLMELMTLTFLFNSNGIRPYTITNGKMHR
jgi:hypothetical protein